LGLLKTFLSSAIVLFAVAKIIPGISYQNDLRVLLAAALVFALIQILITPILGFLTLPFNLLSFGLASVVINVGLFYLISYLVPSFTFSSFEFSGYTSGNLVIPSLSVPRYGTVAVGATLASILLTLVRKVLRV